MAQNIIAFLQAHGLGMILLVFTLISILLDTAAKIFLALGKVAPAWLATGANWVGKIIHFLNGNTTAAAQIQK